MRGLYVELLNRNPKESELEILNTKISERGLPITLLEWFSDFELLSRAKELAISKPSGLSGMQMKNVVGLRKLAFLHIPKTSGTRLKERLPYSLGIDWVDLDILWHNEFLAAQSRSYFDFWPLVTGHSRISNFPPGHAVLAFFRESRSRLLSLFGHSQQMSNTPEFMKRLRLKDFLEACWTHLDLEPYFWPLHRFFSIREDTDVACETLVGRTDFAQWSHDSKGIEKTVASWLGREVRFDGTTKSNTTNYSELTGFRKTLTQSDIVALEHYASREDSVIDILVELKKLRRLSPEERDMEFKTSLSKFDLSF